MDIVSALFLTLGALVILYVVRWGAALYRSQSLERGASQRAAAPSLTHILIGLVTNFFDTLGIGSFATTTSTYKLLGLVPDERIPGTMLVGHTLPVVVQAFAFISIVSVDRTLLVSLIVAMMAGGWLGAGVVSRLPRRVIQLGMATALLLAGFFMTIGLLRLYPTGGQALALEPIPFAVAWVGNFVLGALATLGIGNYGPSLVLYSMLGMDPRAAFPIMMGSGSIHGCRRGTAVHKKRVLRRPCGDRADGRRHSRSADRRVAREIAAARCRSVGGHCRRGVYGCDAPQVRVRRSPGAGGGECEQSGLEALKVVLRVQPGVIVFIVNHSRGARPHGSSLSTCEEACAFIPAIACSTATARR